MGYDAEVEMSFDSSSDLNQNSDLGRTDGQLEDINKAKTLLSIP